MVWQCKSDVPMKLVLHCQLSPDHYIDIMRVSWFCKHYSSDNYSAAKNPELSLFREIEKFRVIILQFIKKLLFNFFSGTYPGDVSGVVSLLADFPSDGLITCRTSNTAYKGGLVTLQLNVVFQLPLWSFINVLQIEKAAFGGSNHCYRQLLAVRRKSVRDERFARHKGER